MCGVNFTLFGCEEKILSNVHIVQWRKVEQSKVTFQLGGAHLELFNSEGAHKEHQALHIRDLLVFRVYVTRWIYCPQDIFYKTS